MKRHKTLNSERLVMEAPQEHDFTRFYEIHSDPETNLFNPAGPMSMETARTTFDEWLSHWEIYEFGTWTIRLKDSATIVGFGGLSYRMYGNELKLNVGYRFDKDYWGKGYATELTEYTIKYGFEELLFDKIYAIVRPKHIVSIRVLEKTGMRLLETLDDVPGQESSLVYIIESNG